MTSVVTTRPHHAPPGARVPRRVRRALYGLVLVAVLGVSALQLRTVDWASVLAGLQWHYAAVAALAALTSIAGAAWNLIGFSPPRLSLRDAALAQLAGTALKVVTPASVGTVAVNARLVHRRGAAAGASVVAVAASQAAQFVVTLVLIALVVLAGGAGAAAGSGQQAVLWHPHVPRAAVVAGAVLGVALLAAHRWWWRLVPVTATTRLAEIGPQLLAVLRDPRRCLAGFGGGLLLTAGLVGALWGSIRAAGGDLALLPVLVVLLAGSALGSTVPTPGGVGGVEAAMTAGLVAAGLPLAQAMPAVVLYRALSFWLLVPLGTLAAADLRHRALL